MARLFRNLLPIIVLVSILAVSLSGAVVDSFVENFTTTEYKSSYTTAWWDTVAGEIKLPEFHPVLTGTYNTPGTAYTVAVAGNLAYVTDWTGGLQIVDITDPATPSFVGSYITSDYAMGIAVSGDYAYVGASSDGLLVIDVEDPATPALVGSYTMTYANDLFVSGDYAYVAGAGDGLAVFDIQNPAAPTLAGSYNTPGSSQDVVVDGDYAYVTDGGEGLRVIDVSDPTSPVLAGSYNTDGWAAGLGIAGNTAYVCDGFSGLQILDITDPTTPTLVATYNTPHSATTVQVTGDHAWVADASSGLLVIDVTNPAFPALIDSYNTPGTAYGVAVTGIHAFVADAASGLQVITVEDRMAPLFYSDVSLGGGKRVTVAGNNLFCAHGYGGISVVDISDPVNMVTTGTLTTPDNALDIAVAGNKAYVAADDSGLVVVDVTDPTTPVFVASYVTTDKAEAVVVQGDYAYLAVGDAGLVVIDISDPATPTLAGQYDTPTLTANDVFVDGNHVFIAADSDGLQVVDITDPTTPVLAGNDVPANTVMYALVVEGNLAYVVGNNDGTEFMDDTILIIYDVTDPSAPVLRPGIRMLNRRGYDVAVSGDFAFVATGSGGVDVLDITSSSLLWWPIDNYNMSSVGVAVDGDYVYSTGSTLTAAIQMFNHKFYTAENLSISTGIAYDVAAVKLTTTQVDSIQWKVSSAYLEPYVVVNPGEWTYTGTIDSWLGWRSTHVPTAGGGNPGCSYLKVEWLYTQATIDAIVDVPGDQGGWVRIYFTRSGCDLADASPDPVSGYNIHREVTGMALVANILREGREVDGDSPSLASAAGDPAAVSPYAGDRPLIEWQGRYFFQGAGPEAGPPGLWEVVATVFAQQQQEYIVTVPTPADSSDTGDNQARFYISAHTTTPSVFYDSAIDSGYSVDNIAPGVPGAFAVVYNTGGGNQLTWDPSEADDFQYFRVYRSTTPDFLPAPGNLVHSLVGTDWEDPVVDGWLHHYKVTALDYAGNESDPATAGTVTAAGEPSLPERFALHNNVPNPFNPTTTIHYDVPAGGGDVTIRIYDVSGALVHTLVSGFQTPGQKTVVWNGANLRGNRVASGVYFCRLQAPGFMKTHKMMLIE